MMTEIHGDPFTRPGEIRIIRTKHLRARFVGSLAVVFHVPTNALLGWLHDPNPFWRCPDDCKHEFEEILDRVMDDRIAAEMARQEGRS